MNEITVRITNDETVSIEETVNGVKRFKRIDPDALMTCLSKSLVNGGSFSGLLPNGCLSYAEYDNGDRCVSLLFAENRADISYYGTVYKDFPLPKLVFSFMLNSDGRILNCGLGVTANENVLKPDSPMYRYPFSNVSGFALCTGNNALPRCKSLHTLGSLPYFIMAMPNNNDHFTAKNNKAGLEMRDLLETLKDKEPDYYYGGVLIPFDGKFTLYDFIQRKNVY